MRFAFNPYIVGVLVVTSFFVTLLNIDLVIYTVFFLLPFEWTGSFAFDTSTHLGTIIRPIQVLFAGAIPAFLLLVLTKKQKIYNDRSFLYFLLFAISALISAVLVNYYRVWQVYPYIFYAFFVFYFIAQAVRAKHLGKIEKVLGAVTILTVAYGVFQFVGDLVGLSNKITGLQPWYTKAWTDITRIQSVSREPLYYGSFLLIPLMLFYTKYLSADAKRAKNYFALFLTAAGALFLTLSRGAIAAAAVGLVLVSFLKFQEFKKKFKVLALTLAIFLALAAGGLVVAAKIQNKPALSWVKGYYEQAVTVVFKGKHGSIVSRREGALVGLDAFAAKPIFGLGLGGIGPWYEGYPQTPPEDWFVVLNMPLTLFAETGIVGTVIFILFILSIMKPAYHALKKSEGEVALWLTAAFVIYISMWVQYLSFSYFFYTQAWVMLGLILALTKMTGKKI